MSNEIYKFPMRLFKNYKIISVGCMVTNRKKVSPLAKYAPKSKEYWESDAGLEILKQFINERITINEICKRMNLTESELASFLSESEKIKSVLFSAAVGNPVDAAEVSLYEMANGYTYEFERTIQEENLNRQTGEMEITYRKTTTEKRFKPKDIQAAKVVLFNQRPDEWEEHVTVKVITSAEAKDLAKRWKKMKAVDDNEDLLIGSGDGEINDDSE